MADLVYYVDPDVSGGSADGSSWANAYSSLSAAVTARATNLVTATDTHEYRCRSSSGSADTTLVDLGGYTTSSTYYVKFVGYKQNGTDKIPCTGYDTDEYRIGNSSLGYHVSAIDTGGNDSHLFFENMQLFGESASYAGLVGTYDSQSGDDIHWQFDKCCLIRQGGVNTYWLRMSTSGTTTGQVVARNCLFLNDSGSTIRQDFYSDVNWYIYNCTWISNSAMQCSSWGTHVDFRNNLTWNQNEDDFYQSETPSGTSDYNADNANTTPGAHDVDLSDYGTGCNNGNPLPHDLFKDIDTSGDPWVFNDCRPWHTDIVNAATDISGATYGMSDDINGATRSSWDIGFAEYVDSEDVEKCGPTIETGATSEDRQTLAITIPTYADIVVVAYGHEESQVFGPSNDEFSINSTELTLIDHFTDVGNDDMHTGLAYIKTSDSGTGSQTLAYDYDSGSSRGRGISILVTYYKNVDTSSVVKDYDKGANSSSTLTISSLSTDSGDLTILAACREYSGYSAFGSGQLYIGNAYYGSARLEMTRESNASEATASSSSALAGVAAVLTKASSGDALTAEDIAAGTPTLETPTIGQTHGLTASEISSGTPTVETPTIGQVHGLTASEVTAGAPTLETPTLSEAADALTANDVTAGTPTLETPTIGQVHALTASEIAASAPTLETPTIGQIHVLSASEIAAGAPTLETPTLGEGNVDACTAQDITAGVPTLETPTIGQEHALSTLDLYAGTPTLDAPQIGAKYVVPIRGSIVAASRGGKAIFNWSSGSGSESVTLHAGSWVKITKVN